MPEWHVDCEYNRNSNNTKQLPNPKQIKIDNENRRNVFPDIIVHRRSTRSNHLVIEVKKSSNGECRNPDYTKLRAFQSDKKYK